MKNKTHAELDKMWKKLTKNWKIKCLQFIKDEKEIVDLAKRMERERRKMEK